MSQDSIIDILKKNRRKWFSASSLKGLTDCNDSNVVRNVSRIVKYKSVYGVEVKKGKKRKNFIRFL
jgi:hypothetical protein